MRDDGGGGEWRVGRTVVNRGGGGGGGGVAEREAKITSGRTLLEVSGGTSKSEAAADVGCGSSGGGEREAEKVYAVYGSCEDVR